MSFADGGSHGLAYVSEVTWGTTPSTPAMIDLRHTGCTLALSKNAFQSQELRNDRMISDLRHGAKQVGGDINFELSYGEFDTLLEMALFGSWSSDVLKAGTTAKSATFERAFSDITQYLVYTGCMVRTMSLSIKPDAIVTGSFSLVGKNADDPDTSPLDASPTASQTNSPFDSFTGAITEGGASIAVVTGLDLTLDNSLNPAFVVGSNTAGSITAGRSNLTGTLSAYFENSTLLQKFISETESSLVVDLEDLDGNTLTITIPKIKYSGADVPVQGEGPVTMSMPFQAIYDATTGTNIQIERTAA